MKYHTAIAGCAFAVLAAVRSQGADIGDVRLNGYVAGRMEKCISNHVCATDPLYLTRFFHNRQQTWMWHGEFWGKWMHSAVPFAKYTGNERLKANIEEGADDIISTQDSDGYIGNYPESRRYGKGTWDVWSTKYTLLGLLYADRLDAAEKLANCLMRHFSGAELYRSGWYRGMPSCSVLEPIVWLYRRTKKQEYLDFALYLRDQMDREDGARLIRDCDIPVFERVTGGALDSSLKAYEMMSCYQGLIEFACVLRERGDTAESDRLVAAAVKTAEHILAEEINIVGGAASGEHWYGGAARETEEYNRQNETCVITTWLRFLRRIYEETRDARWIDAFEKTFYNAFLGALKPDGSAFTQYCPLAGTRAIGEHHCRTFTNCCNANGPRGFIEYLQAAVYEKDGTVAFNLYDSGFFRAGDIEFQVYTTYPRSGRVEIWYRTEKAKEFTLAPRIPGWCRKFGAKVNGENVQLPVKRVWQPGDVVELVFDMAVEKHVKNDRIAFTRGPVVLARDARFGGSAIGEVVRRCFYSDGSGETKMPRIEDVDFEFRQVRTEDDALWMKFVGILPTGSHAESTEAGFPEAVFFTDFASAGNTWNSGSDYRVWLPVLRFEPHR